MELIIKPTGLCNFSCEFCSAHGMDIQHPSDGHVPQQIKDLIKKLKPNGLIITGGEPLMVSPEYYYELHDIAHCPIAPTTNLKDFCLNPDKWAPLFKEDWFNITTSFNYGETRRWSPDKVYTEHDFIHVLAQLRAYTGKSIDSFIAVIDESNEEFAHDHVDLAKTLGCKVRLNGAIGVGKQGKTYPRYKMMKIYLEIIDNDMDQYECNCFERTQGKCPWNIGLRCQNCIRCCYVDNSGKLHVGTCDERMSMGIELLEDQIIPTTCEETPINPQEYIKPECAYCELCRLCNGCHTNRQEAKKDPDYCEEMKKLEDQIIDAGWIL
ncbi:MAG: radical SAM protein [Lachnospiraceae bacterium]|nr:radical SAM protein [Lachnospiraceae bacterium]MCM1230745.1 radical SAM protein [Ruminococcus flavefaciens]